MDLNTDPMARLLGVTLAEQTPNGAVTTAVVERRHLNPYRIAHGGFAYTMGCVTAMAAARLHFGRETAVLTVSSQYLSALGMGAARCECTLLYDDGTHCAYRVSVEDGSGRPSFLQQVTLRNAGDGSDAPPLSAPTIFPAGPEVPADPVTGLRFPMLSPGAYDSLTQIYLLGAQGNTSTLATDLRKDTVDAHGAAHCGLVYSLCDSGVGATSGLVGKMAVTVSSVMNYFRPAVTGPVTAKVQCVRSGRTITYFQVDAFDGGGVPVAVGQFCLHPKSELNALVFQELAHGV